MEMKCYCWGYFFYLALTGEKRNEGMERRVIAEGSTAAAEGVAGGSQGRAVQQEGHLGSLLVLGSPDRACRACWACWACCTGRKRKGCSP